MNINLNDNIQELRELEKDATACLHGKMSTNQLAAKTKEHLGRITSGKMSFKTSIIRVKTSKPFIMCVYPSVQDLEDYAPKLISCLNNGNVTEFVDTWNSIPNWNIEVDSRLFDPMSSIHLDNGAQYVAILCHELGHVMNTHPAAMAMNYNKNKVTYSVYEKLFMDKPFISLLFLPMFVCISGFRIVIGKPSHDIDEISADMRVPDEYKPHLMDYIQFHILNQANSGVVVTGEEFSTEQDQGIQFTRSCLSLMKKRRHIIKAQLATQHKVSDSPYYKEICSTTAKIVTKAKLDSDKRELTGDKYLVEAFERVDMEVTKEAYAILEGISVSERDIVLLQVDIENMRTPEDKSQVLNTIFDYIESLEHRKAKAAKKFKDVDKIPVDATLELRMKQLRELQKKAMDTPVSQYGNHYGVFVRYPEGYEG